MSSRRGGQAVLLSADGVLHRAAERLAHQYAGMVGEETVERVVFESYTALGRTAKVSTHLPSLAEKFARDRLAALAQSRGVLAKPVPEVLYVCVQNSGRSQIAAALTRHLGDGRVHVRSPDRNRPPSSCPPSSPSSQRSASAWPTSSRSRSPTTSCVLPTRSSRWAAAMRARSIRASATWTGSSPTRPSSISTACARCATTSGRTSSRCSPS